jgi:hypothetical protein
MRPLAYALSFTLLPSALSISLAMTLSAAPASAQPRLEQRQDRRELRQDHKEIRQDQRAVRDDMRDARRFANLLAAFDQASATRNPAQISDVDRRVLAAIEGEVRESSREVAQKGAEAARSQGEVRRDRREVGRDVARNQPGQAADDRRDLRDDRRDARDDRRDARREMIDNGRLRAIQQEYTSLANLADPQSLGRKRGLLVELNNMAAAEIREDRREIREDRREIREDRRELREDRRQGH